MSSAVGQRWPYDKDWQLCDCIAFKHWYSDYCECGHGRREHLDGKRSCVGWIENG